MQKMTRMNTKKLFESKISLYKRVTETKSMTITLDDWLHKVTPAAKNHITSLREVNKTDPKAIPSDYDGVMGVPITFLDKWNPGQFEIVDTRDNIGESFDTVDGSNTYNRILIKRK